MTEKLVRTRIHELDIIDSFYFQVSFLRKRLPLLHFYIWKQKAKSKPTYSMFS
jgi:hypothetical protein